ncbi:glycosyltransferase family 2 protein [Siccirubricoccus phaeus]|uniref:glycosyltransferase family 2 protein n=1 Tax=Siccirubricoccus phaeus TaxID=2595053 RepID=UPI0011F1C0A6|nr:glycosyltransferase [Siccirubricoccus phaeus]
MPSAPAPPLPALSLLLCTRNRAPALAASLAALGEALAAEPGLTAEVVVVDNGSTDGTPAVIAGWAAAMPFPVLHRVEARPGLAAARNAAVRAARGRLLAFTDDDCHPAPGYFRDLRRHFAADRVPTIRGGRVELGDPEDLPVTIKLDPDPARLQRLTRPSGFIHGCNMAMHRQVLERLGPFDERFGAGTRLRAGEDTDLFIRAVRAGVPVHYVPDMAVRHYHGRRGRAALRRLVQGYTLANGALCAKHFRDGAQRRHFWWDLQRLARDWSGGTRPDFPLTRAAAMLATLQGMALYLATPRAPRRDRALPGGLPDATQ